MIMIIIDDRATGTMILYNTITSLGDLTYQWDLGYYGWNFNLTTVTFSSFRLVRTFQFALHDEGTNLDYSSNFYLRIILIDFLNNEDF